MKRIEDNSHNNSQGQERDKRSTEEDSMSTGSPCMTGRNQADLFTPSGNSEQEHFKTPEGEQKLRDVRNKNRFTSRRTFSGANIREDFEALKRTDFEALSEKGALQKGSEWYERVYTLKHNIKEVNQILTNALKDGYKRGDETARKYFRDKLIDWDEFKTRVRSEFKSGQTPDKTAIQYVQKEASVYLKQLDKPGNADDAQEFYTNLIMADQDAHFYETRLNAKTEQQREKILASGLKGEREKFEVYSAILVGKAISTENEKQFISIQQGFRTLGENTSYNTRAQLYLDTRRANKRLGALLEKDIPQHLEKEKATFYSLYNRSYEVDTGILMFEKCEFEVTKANLVNALEKNPNRSDRAELLVDLYRFNRDRDIKFGEKVMKGLRNEKRNFMAMEKHVDPQSLQTSDRENFNWVKECFQLLDTSIEYQDTSKTRYRDDSLAQTYQGIFEMNQKLAKQFKTEVLKGLNDEKEKFMAMEVKVDPKSLHTSDLTEFYWVKKQFEQLYNIENTDDTRAKLYGVVLELNQKLAKQFGTTSESGSSQHETDINTTTKTESLNQSLSNLTLKNSKSDNSPDEHVPPIIQDQPPALKRSAHVGKKTTRPFERRGSKNSDGSPTSNLPSTIEIPSSNLQYSDEITTSPTIVESPNSVNTRSPEEHRQVSISQVQKDISAAVLQFEAVSLNLSQARGGDSTLNTRKQGERDWEHEDEHREAALKLALQRIDQPGGQRGLNKDVNKGVKEEFKKILKTMEEDHKYIDTNAAKKDDSLLQYNIYPQKLRDQAKKIRNMYGDGHQALVVGELCKDKDGEKRSYVKFFEELNNAAKDAKTTADEIRTQLAKKPDQLRRELAEYVSTERSRFEVIRQDAGQDKSNYNSAKQLSEKLEKGTPENRAKDCFELRVWNDELEKLAKNISIERERFENISQVIYDSMADQHGSNYYSAKQLSEKLGNGTSENKVKDRRELRKLNDKLEKLLEEPISIEITKFESISGDSIGDQAKSNYHSAKQLSEKLGNGTSEDKAKDCLKLRKLNDMLGQPSEDLPVYKKHDDPPVYGGAFTA